VAYGYPFQQEQARMLSVRNIVLDILFTVNEAERLRKINSNLPGLIEFLDGAIFMPMLRVYFNNKLRELWKSRFPNVPYPEVKVTPEDSLLKIYSELRKIVLTPEYEGKILSELGKAYVFGRVEIETTCLNELNKLLFDTVVYLLIRLGILEPTWNPPR